MPRSKTRALARAARLAEWERAGEDDSGRTPERVAYVRQEIRRRLQRLEAMQPTSAVTRQAAPAKADSPDET